MENNKIRKVSISIYELPGRFGVIPSRLFYAFHTQTGKDFLDRQYRISYRLVMKTIYVIKNILLVGLSCVVFWGCNSNNPDKTSASDALKNQNIGNQSGVSLYTIADKTAGIFKIGSAVPETNDFQFLTEDKIVNKEGDRYKYKVCRVYGSDKLLLELRLSDTNTIDEILVVSDKFTTKEGNGVGSFLTKILTNEHDFELFYTYVSGRFIVFQKQTPELQFLIDPKSFKGERKKLTSSDMVLLKSVEFSEDSKISQIRIF